MNHTTPRSLVELRSQAFQFGLCQGFVTGGNRTEKPFLPALKPGQNALVPQRSLLGLSCSLGGRSRICHSFRFGQDAETSISSLSVNRQSAVVSRGDTGQVMTLR